MKLERLLNRKISFTKTTFYILVLFGCLIGVLSGIYSSDIFKYFGLDFLANNSLLIGLVLMIVGSASVLTNILFRGNKENINISDNDVFNKQINDLENASSSVKSLERFIAEQKNALVENNKILEKLNHEREKLSPI